MVQKKPLGPIFYTITKAAPRSLQIKKIDKNLYTDLFREEKPETFSHTSENTHNVPVNQV